MPEYDAIIIGTGQAGPALARRLTAAGMQVAVIEREQFGGTCVNTGCTPTKTLVASAYAAHMARRAADFGVTIEGRVSVDMKKVKARKDYVTGLFNRGVERALRSNPKCTVYIGHARLISPREVFVVNEVLGAQKIFINVGGRALIPDIPGLNKVDYFTTVPF
jgi:pyruvate/2-oxoglutarate dehydrogenase complex dihydrolipoamide dehydrogenase (E3) component